MTNTLTENVLVGTSPTGIEWWAYANRDTTEDVTAMRLVLAEHWLRATTRRTTATPPVLTADEHAAVIARLRASYKARRAAYYAARDREMAVRRHDADIEKLRAATREAGQRCAESRRALRKAERGLAGQPAGMSPAIK